MKRVVTVFLGVALSGALSLPAAWAQQLELYFDQPLEGVYSQSWSGRVIGADPAGGVLVYLRGAGKTGDFHGVMLVVCAEPQMSAWVSRGGVLSSDHVPKPAISIIHAEACGSP